MEDGSLTKHGFPRGYRFVPKPLELISLLNDLVDGKAFPPPLDNIFHRAPILSYHPEQLYERYKEDAEHRYIYFFGDRRFQMPGAAAPLPEDKNQKEPRPVRMASGGGWKPSGGGQVLRWPRKKGGFIAGRMVTMVFYDARVAKGATPAKTEWGMHEFTVPVDRTMTSLTTKNIRFRDLALYRLYILKSGDMETENEAAGSSSQMMPNAAYDHCSPSTSAAPCSPLQPWGIFTGNRQLFAGASTSKMPQPQQRLRSVVHAPYYQQQHAFRAAAAGASTSKMPTPQQQLPSVEHAQYYHQQQHPFGAAAAAQQQAHDIPVLGAGLPGNLCQFAILPSPVPVPPAAANPAAHQAPATATPGGGQEAGHNFFGATRSPSPLPATASPVAEQHAASTTEPAGRVQFADCVKPMEEAAAALPISCRPLNTSAWPVRTTTSTTRGCQTGIVSSFDLMEFDDSLFTMEIFGGSATLFDEPPAMEGDNNNSGSGGENCNQAEAGDTQDPSAALSSYASC